MSTDLPVLDTRETREKLRNLDVYLKMRSSGEILVLDPNKHNKLLEVRFEFTFILSSKSTMAVFQANHGPYSNPDTRARLRTSHNSRNLTQNRIQQ